MIGVVANWRIRSAVPAIIALLALVNAGCGEGPSREAIPPFRQGVVTADQQTAAAFTEINSFLRGLQIDRAARQNALTEDLFVEALAASDRAKWGRAFALIDSYSEKLERLLGSEQRTGVESELADLGKKIEALRNDQLPASLSAGFVQLGGLLVQLKAEHDALAAIRKADPAIQRIFSNMMEAIGEDPTQGIRGTVWRSRSQVLATIDVREFRVATTPAAKRTAAQKYAQILDQREAEDQSLAALRLSLATLAKAHQELANGRNINAGALIKLVQDEYKAYRERLDAIKKERDSAAGGNS